MAELLGVASLEAVGRDKERATRSEIKSEDTKSCHKHHNLHLVLLLLNCFSPPLKHSPTNTATHFIPAPQPSNVSIPIFSPTQFNHPNLHPPNILHLPPAQQQQMMQHMYGSQATEYNHAAAAAYAAYYNNYQQPLLSTTTTMIGT